MTKISKIAFALACVALASVSSLKAAPIVTMQQSEQGGYQVLDFFYSASEGSEFTAFGLDVTCLTGGTCISDPNRGGTSGSTQWDSIDGGPRLDTWMNTVFSYLYDNPASYQFNVYKPNNPGQSPIPTAQINWDVFDTETGDTNDADPEVGVAPYHLARVLTAVGSTGTALFRAGDLATAGLTSFNFNFGGTPGTAPTVVPLLIDNVNASDPGLVQGVITHDGTGDDPITWGGFSFASFTPTYGSQAQGDAVGAGATFDEGTQEFSWNSVGAPRGTYVWDVLASNAAGDGAGTITVNVTGVPEPATVALVGLALVGLAGIRRRG